MRGFSHTGISLLQKYNVAAPAGVKLNPGVVTSVVCGPKPLKLIFKPIIVNQ